LFAVTAVPPSPRDIASWQQRDAAPLPPEAPAIDLGELQEIDLAGGTFGSETRYTAPDGTVLEGSRAYSVRGATVIHIMKVGYVTVDNNLGWQVHDKEPAHLTVTFPESRSLAAIALLGLPESPEYVFENRLSGFNYTVAVSSDGETWETVASRQGYLPDRDHEGVHRWPAREVKAVRVTVTPVLQGPCMVRGLARVRLFAPKP
jgi:hypothetical protein